MPLCFIARSYRKNVIFIFCRRFDTFHCFCSVVKTSDSAPWHKITNSSNMGGLLNSQCLHNQFTAYFFIQSTIYNIRFFPRLLSDVGTAVDLLKMKLLYLIHGMPAAIILKWRTV